MDQVSQIKSESSCYMIKHNSRRKSCFSNILELKNFQQVICRKCCYISTWIVAEYDDFN